MTDPRELLAFPLLALAVIVFVAVAIAGGELLRRLFLRVFGRWLGPAAVEPGERRGGRTLRARSRDHPA
jgi:hypothetical protein